MSENKKNQGELGPLAGELLKDKRVGFIGCGNMAQAMIGGMVSSGVVQGSQLLVSNRSKGKLEAAKEKYGVAIAENNRQTARESDLLFLAVKPGMFPQVIGEIKDSVREDTVIISIAAGQTLSGITKLFGQPVRLIRSMPNTPALVGESMSALCPGDKITDEELLQVQALFASFGTCEVIPEALIDAFGGVSGSSPAYMFMMLEAMADAAVAEGISRAQAYRFAGQAMYGSAKMLLETGKHPGELKDMVCSPSGTTIEGVDQLERCGFRSAVIGGIRSCIKKSKEMSGK